MDDVLKNKYLKAFSQFGIEFAGSDGADNYFATCPFTDKENKFFVNATNGLWDSKTAGKSGNITSFVRLFTSELLNNTDSVDLKTLVDKKKLPPWIMHGVVGFNPVTNKYIIPYRNINGDIVNTGHYDVNAGRMIKTSTLKQYMLGTEELASSESNTVFICEGEWDYFAMKWLLKRNNLNHVVIGMPSANVFKDDWVEFFRDKEVYCMLDNDVAGRNGTDRIQKMISKITVSIRYINWPEATPEKYDVRDFILDFCGNINSFKTKHKKCYDTILTMFHVDTPNELLGVSQKPVDDELPDNIEIPKAEEIEKVFNKWFKIRGDDISLDVMVGACLANKIEGDPVWLYLVGAPGSRKTAMLMSLNKSKYIETVSTLTPASLVSGMRATGSEDPSLIPKLDRRMLVIKDVTTMLSGPSFVRDEIFGILRDAFDGYIEKVFGNGLKKSFKSRFGVIGAVTPVIDGYQSAQSILGERFLKLRIEPEMKMDSEFDVISRTLDNIDNESKMNEEMQDIMFKMLSKKPPEKRLEFQSTELKHRVISTGMFVARLRGSINSNLYTKEQQSLPIQEVGTRVTKQLTKLAMGIACFRNHTNIGIYEVSRVQQVAIDTCPDRVQSVVKLLNDHKGEPVFTQQIIEHTMLSPATISTLLNSLVSLRILKKVKGAERVKSSYTLTDDLKTIIEKSGVYDKFDFTTKDVSVDDISDDVTDDVMYSPTETPADTNIVEDVSDDVTETPDVSDKGSGGGIAKKIRFKRVELNKKPAKKIRFFNR